MPSVVSCAGKKKRIGFVLVLSIVVNQGHNYFIVGGKNFLCFSLEIFKVKSHELQN